MSKEIVEIFERIAQYAAGGDMVTFKPVNGGRVYCEMQHCDARLGAIGKDTLDAFKKCERQLLRVRGVILDS